VIGTVRGISTVVAAAGVGLLIWAATQIGTATTDEYWASSGIIAAGGLALALSQLLGGWTKWGWPRISLGVLFWAFVPTLICVGWVLLAGQPEANWFQGHISAWSDDIGIGGVVEDLTQYVGVLAFGLGFVFGLSFDTTGPAPTEVAVHPREIAPAPEPTLPPDPERQPVGAASGPAERSDSQRAS
jgi:hypothetical protein